MNPKRGRRRCRALTLLELLLALSLMVMVMMTIGMAINMHFRLLDLRRTNVEEAVEVRSVLNMIAKDIGSAMQYTPPDTSGIDLMAGNLATAATSALGSGDPAQAAALIGGATGAGSGTGGGTGGGGQQGAGGGTGAAPTGGQTGGQTAQTGGAAQSGGAKPIASSAVSGSKIGGAIASAPPAATSAATTPVEGETATATATASVVGLYGRATELKIDVSRLPRLDQYDAMYSATGDTGAAEIPSDVKTIVYFLASEETPLDPRAPAGTQDVQPSITGTGKGLMRRELDRAVKSYAEANGDTSSLYYGARVVSDKVVGLEFKYFDGTTWLADWDSDALGGLPKAVEVNLTIQNTYGMTEDEIATQGASTLPVPKPYRLVVKIPTANPAPPAAEETTEADASGSASTASGGAASTGTMP